MEKTSDIIEYIQSLLSSEGLRHQVVYHTVLPAASPRWSKPERPWPAEIEQALSAIRVSDLYRHQAQAVDLIRSGQHVAVATPTASGKSLIYNLPALEKVWANAAAKALYLFPLKALAQDQRRAFEEIAARCGGAIQPTAEIYDGDTSAWHRKRIRQAPPNVLMTNPEMLHLSFLAHHGKWSTFFSQLEMVVVDEVHTYRGILGSHMAQLFRRLQRVCAFYGASPTFVFSSATVANPGQLVDQLTGLEAQTIAESGAPQGRRHVVFVNPPDGPVQTAILLLKAALHRGLRTIVYTQSRKLAELISLWAGSRSGQFASRISAYRAGFLAEERREIEARLAKGELLAVISTSALELGIDIGDLDLCILVGYPGTVVATWQRGGRVGRGGQDSGLVLIAGEDALDQYLMRHPAAFIARAPETAVVNPHNPEIMARHMVCAAAELPLDAGEPFLSGAPVRKCLLNLEQKGDLLRSSDGHKIYARQRAPHRYVNLRGTGDRFKIVDSRTERNIGEVDGFRAFRETHPGAVYLHKGDTYRVEQLDPDTKTVKARKARLDYYTRVRADKETEILEVFEEKAVWGARVCTGRLKITDQVTGYEKWRIRDRQKMNIFPLDLPPQIFETQGLWFKVPSAVQKKAESKYLHFMGGIHAIEHAAIGIFPVLVMADRNDLGGIATPFHRQTDGPAIFIYDGIPGGAGLCREAFGRAEALLDYTLRVIKECPCEFGCPSCVHSPKCGSGNRPIDKSAALFLLDKIQNAESAGDISVRQAERNQSEVSKKRRGFVSNLRFGVFDLETQRSAQEVGGWHRSDRMGVSCVVLYDSRMDRFVEFLEDDIPRLIEHLRKLDLVIGFNIKRFDYQVLSGYTDFDFRRLASLDILEQVHKRLGYRLSLDHLARVTLGASKTADGLQALRWWQQGKIREILDYCKTDVAITRDLFLFGRTNGYLLFQNKAGNVVRVPVDW